MPDDDEYLRIVLEPIRVSAGYQPKFGQGGDGLSLEEFRHLYRNDPFYGWFGLDSPLLYAAHKAAGGMTSVYRQIGIGCERLFRTILQDCFGLSKEEATWSYEVSAASGGSRKLHLDGRVPLSGIQDKVMRKRFHEWMRNAAKAVQVDAAVSRTLKGAVFEIRQGYKKARIRKDKTPTLPARRRRTHRRTFPVPPFCLRRSTWTSWRGIASIDGPC